MDASLDRRRDGDVSRLLEVRVVEVAVGRDTVEIEQVAAELLADLSECRRELVPAVWWRADDKHLRAPPPGPASAARAILTSRPIDRATMIGSSQYASFVPR